MRAHGDPQPEFSSHLVTEDDVWDHRESNLTLQPQSCNRMSGGRNGNQSSQNVGQFTSSDPDSDMEVEEDTVGDSSGRVHANNSSRHLPYLHSSQSTFPSQPYIDEVATTPHPEQNHYTLVQQSGQFEPYLDFQVATRYTTGHEGGHNEDTVNGQPGQYPGSLSMQHLVPSPIHGPFVGNSMNRARTTGTNRYEDSTHFPRPSHYTSHAPQVDLGQLSQHGRDTLSSSDGPWSPHNPRGNRSPPTMRLTAFDDRRRLGDSDTYSSVRTGSQVFSNASSDGDQWTTDSSVDDMSGSTATIRPLDQIFSNQETSRIDAFESRPPRARTASSTSESLHGEYGRNLQDTEPHNRPYDVRSWFGAHPTFSASGTPHLEVPQQQQQVGSAYSSPASAPSPPLPDTIGCYVPFCSAKYSGSYRKGNLARHMRLKHGISEQVYNCEARGCSKCFKRQDARLKHYRKHHPELSSGPALSRGAHHSSELQEHYLRGIS